MKTKTIPKLTLIFSVACFTCSCAKPAQTTENATPGSIASKLILRGNLKYIKITDLKAQKKNGFMMVEAEAHNIRTSDDTIYYRFKWLDSNGFTAGSEESWKTIPLRGLESQKITGIATSKTASDFKIELQSPNNTGD